MKAVASLVAATVVVLLAAHLCARTDVSDAQLEASSAGRVVRVGPANGGGGRVAALPLEVYVARVLAGEAEPRAADAAQQALAVAIRTFALANAGRHARDGFDLCDGTHCQVLRTATVGSRRATLATAGHILTYDGAPAELFYSASCGGYSESADQVWPGADYPYLQAAPDDVHDDDPPWTIELPLEQMERALERVGFQGRLRDVRIEARSASGRAARLKLDGLVPDVIAGEQFRSVIGTTTLRSTAFSIEKRGRRLRFTGRGFGHGVGMCVIGAGRRAARGATVRTILGQYYPGLALTPIDRVTATTRLAQPAPAFSVAPPAAAARPGRGAVLVRVPPSLAVTEAEVEELAMRAHDALARILGVPVAPIAVRVHESLESFRAATGQPWWVSSVSEGASIDLVPPALLAQRNGLEPALRIAVAELLVAPALRGRPLWVRVGAARYFAREGTAPQSDAAVRCPADAELRLAIAASAQRDAEARAEACFARAYARTRDWRAVR